MLTVNIHEAKTHLSRLIEAEAMGEPFIIAQAKIEGITLLTADRTVASYPGPTDFAA